LLDKICTLQQTGTEIHNVIYEKEEKRQDNGRKHAVENTGLFISPSGIFDPCGTIAGMVTPKGSMSTEGETLQVSVLPYRCSIC